MSGSVTVFHGAVVTPVSLRHWEALPSCILVVGPTGNIEWMHPHVEAHEVEATLTQKGYSSHQVVVLKDGEFIIPGFIDTHTHAPQYPNLGKGGQFQLLQWLKEVVFPKEAEFEDKDFAKDVYYEVVRRSLNSGTTTSCYYGSLHLDATTILADAVNDLGQRAFVGKCNMDRAKENPDYYMDKSTEVSLEETKSLISYIRSLSPKSSHASVGTAPEPLVQPILTPRFAISCTSEVMYGLRDIADEHNTQHPNEPRMRIQTHIAENLGEVKHIHDIYPDAKSYADVYYHHGLLRETTVLAHAVHLTDDEIELIKTQKSGISHCPTSNFYLTSGIAPVGKYLDAGVKVGLGTDVGGGYAVSLLNVIQNASIAAKLLAFNASVQHPDQDPCPEDKVSFANCQLPIPTLFYLATLGGAQVCNLSHKVGSFAPGKSFDALVVSVLDDTGAIGVWGKEAKSCGTLVDKRKKLEENLERFLFCGDDRNIQRVYVQGCPVGGRLSKK